MLVKGIFFRNFTGRKVTRIEVDGEKFSVHFADGEILSGLNLNELNHVIVTATGR